jgi:hypothetical protein
MASGPSRPVFKRGGYLWAPAAPVNALARHPALNAQGERVYRPHVMADQPDERAPRRLRRIDDRRA